MKKRMLSISLLAPLALFACSASDPISEKEAMKIALDAAGVKESEVTFTQQKYDKEDFEYSFTFATKDTKYAYDIDGNGEILSQEKKQVTQPSTNNDTQTGATTDMNGSNLNEEQYSYLTIALDHFQIKAENISRVQVKKDMDDGIAVYDVEFYAANAEYNCEIQIDNQQIRSSDIDKD